MVRVEIEELDLTQVVALGNRIFDHVVGANAVMLAYLGDQLGLFDCLAERGPMTSVELAAATSTNERYVREWAKALVAGGYLELEDDRFRMTKEAIFQLGDPESPGFSLGLYQLIFGLSQNVPRLLEHFKSGGGIDYSQVGEDVTVGVERMWAPCHEFFLGDWLAQIPGVVDRLQGPSVIADVGCGRGRSSVSLARLFPEATVVGIDYDKASVEAARALAEARGVGDRVSFREQSLGDLTDEKAFDFAYMFHTLHDLPDAAPGLSALRRALKDDGLLVCVESSASEDPAANRGTHMVLFSTISPLFNLPVAMARADDGPGSIVSEAAVHDLASRCGFGTHEAVSIDFPPPSVLHRFHVLRP